MKYYLKKKKQNIGNKIYSIYIFKKHERNGMKQKARKAGGEKEKKMIVKKYYVLNVNKMKKKIINRAVV